MPAAAGRIAGVVWHRQATKYAQEQEARKAAKQKSNKKRRKRRDFRVTVAVAQPSLLQLDPSAADALTIEGKYHLNLHLKLPSTRPESAGKLVERGYIFDGVLPWDGGIQVLMTSLFSAHAFQLSAHRSAGPARGPKVPVC